MASVNLLFYFLGFCLYRTISAAPPFSISTSESLDNLTTYANLLDGSPSLSALPPFPPPNPYAYYLGGPDQVILYILWSESPPAQPRNEAATREALVLAMRNVKAHAAVHQQYIPVDYNLKYQSGNVLLQRFNRFNYFTWELWELVLRGIGEFVKAYRGLYFEFAIFLGEIEDRKHIGAGNLTVVDAEVGRDVVR